MNNSTLLVLFLLLLTIPGCSPFQQESDNFHSYAISRKPDLQLAAYITANTLRDQFSTPAGRREALSVLRCNGFTKVYVEVYRSGLTVSTELLSQTIDFLRKNGFEVVGGIATVPGGETGVQQDGPLTWLNWQNEKTQSDMKKIMEDVAPLFDQFILDDFFCTADTSMESKQARGNSSWSEYRRQLLTGLARTVFIEPAKAKNPGINMIIKYPQWYDRFHEFGYDVATEPALFNKVYVGTETRGQYTQRFGFVQPYEGFINYRWIGSLAGKKIGAAWFDHGDCTAIDFIEQAYQSVLAGATELVIFNFNDYLNGHPGHHLLRLEFEKLADLAATVAQQPVQGVAGYKPPNSDAGGDLYLLDYIGMFGVSLVPVSAYPENADVIFLPTQAAADAAVADKVERSLKAGKKIIMTAGFIDRAKNGDKLAKLAGIQYPLIRENASVLTVPNKGTTDTLPFPLQTDYRLVPKGADVLLEIADATKVPFMLNYGNTAVINTHTFSQADFDAVGEVLLCPRQIGLIELPQAWMNTIRSVFTDDQSPQLDAPSRVSFQKLSDSSYVIHNYNQQNADIKIQMKAIAGNWVDAFSGDTLPLKGNTLQIAMEPRSRFWIQNKRN
ncbi:MAG: hypothetical protein IT250_02190 [Chitinophagaceae bacterium]|nr:hypothetical protein [Chitinophagaceae bacterium]